MRVIPRGLDTVPEMTNPVRKRSRSDLLKEAPAGAEVWVVDLEQQRVHRHLGDGIWDTAAASTSRFGIGYEPDSNRTPAGWHRVGEIFGRKGDPQQEYISREPVPPSDREDRILSRILWLGGLEPELNATSQDRYIYVHGTNQIDRLGTAASMGCVRMDPEVIATWVDELNGQEVRVWIGPLRT